MNLLKRISGVYKIDRKWGHVASDTFKCYPINQFVMEYIKNSYVSVDVFARNFTKCTYSNDINPETKAKYHMNAYDFLCMLSKKKVVADLVIFDPPYSLEQVKRSYQSMGIEKIPYEETKNAIGWYKEKDIVAQILPKGGTFLHFGWHTNGMGLKRGFKIKEILIVAHGRCVNDTLCLAEKRVNEQFDLNI